MKKVFRLLPMAFLLALVLMSCQEPALLVESITLDKTEVKMAVGDTITIGAVVKPEGAIDKLVWKSGDELIARVDQNGNVEAVGTGTAEIMLSTEDGRIKAAATVQVGPALTGMTIMMGSEKAEGKSIVTGGKGVLSLKSDPEDYILPDVIWSCSDDKILKVDQKGNIEGISGGIAEVIVKVAGSDVEARSSILVEGLGIIQPMEVMQYTKGFAVIPLYPNEEKLTQVSATSSAPDTCSASLGKEFIKLPDGRLESTPVVYVYGEETGSAAVNVKVRNFSTEFEVTVIPYVISDLVWNTQEIEVPRNEPYDLGLHLYATPRARISEMDISYTSSNPDFEIDAKGKLTVKDETENGETSTITASYGGKVTGELVVKVEPKATSMTVTLPSVVWTQNDHIPLEYEILPEGADKGITVKIDSEVLTYDSLNRRLELNRNSANLVDTVNVEIISNSNSDLSKNMELQIVNVSVEDREEGKSLYFNNEEWKWAPEVLVIPEEIDGKPVIYAEGCINLGDIGLRRIKFPKTIQQIAMFMEPAKAESSEKLVLEFSTSPEWDGLKNMQQNKNVAFENLKLAPGVQLRGQSVYGSGIRELVLPENTELDVDSLTGIDLDKLYVGKGVKPFSRYRGKIFDEMTNVYVYVNMDEGEINVHIKARLTDLASNAKIKYNATLEDYNTHQLVPIESVVFQEADMTDMFASGNYYFNYTITPWNYQPEEITFEFENPEVCKVASLPDQRVEISPKLAGGSTNLIAKGSDGRTLGSWPITVSK